jgi:hypothetical protein
MKNNKQRLFEVMGRLDKTFKPNLNEGFEEIETNDEIEVPTELSGGEEAPVEEKSIEEKYEELKEKVEELYGLINNEENAEEVSIEEPVDAEEVSIEEPVDAENLQEWNFDKKKVDGEKEDDKEKKEDDEKEESSKKIPVKAVAKVGEAK